ncbi:amino acid adenylation domain-containing protein [Cohnella cellulosilytica]|uniref:Amino acid adenylation domain-containing protein n=1 Tax=Cohnella cellulosilytica TaxID=986710 RepID=A0ABW2FSK6_9BACL
MSEASESRAGVLKQALTEIRRLKRELNARRTGMSEPIAVIGMACRLPGGIAGPAELWEALLAKKELIGDAPSSRRSGDWEERLAAHPALRRAGYLTEDIESFDCRLFRMSPKEAERTDPQHRLFLKICYEALENAGYPPDRLRGTATGVYAGVSSPDYAQALFEDSKQRQVLEPGDVTGSGFSFLSGRVSYVFGLQGPGITIDTACSSSLVCVDQACKGLTAGDCDMAIAGGVNLLYSPATTELLSTLHILSPDGVVRSFDAQANGTVRGEGCGAVILKRLSDAERDGDRIHAVIRGSGVNQDGMSSGLTAPYGPAQEKLLARVWARSGIDSCDIGYIEAHGTGTELGDPIELNALGQVMAKDRRTPLYVGTVKANIGHLEAAAGIAGLIKAVLAVENGQIPGQPRFEKPSSHIQWEELSLEVPRETIDWKMSANRLRVAGVSSFGLSGTNAHVVVEQYRGLSERAEPSREDAIKPFPFKFSSVTGKGLRDQLEAMADFLDANAEASPPDMADLSRSQNGGKADWPERAVLWAESPEKLRAAIREALEGRAPADMLHGKTVRKVVFLFTGQGSQYPGMFAGLYRDNRIFREVLDECAACYRKLTGRDLTELLFTPGGRLHETRYTQPALFAVEYALARMWIAYGIEPELMIGHSVGEYAAACVAGVFGLADAMKLITARGELMYALSEGGGMAAIAADREMVARKLAGRGRVTVAAVNGPEQTVISGDGEEVSEICAALAAEGIRSVPLQVSHAFHSPLMQPMLESFRAVARDIRYQAPTRAILSNVTGGPIGAEIADWTYWSRHVMAEVKFMDGIRSIARPEEHVFLEVGPAPVLSTLVERICGDRAECLFSHEAGAADSERLERTLYRLYVRGAAVRWRAWYAEAAPCRMKAPNYRFDEKRYGIPRRALGGNRRLAEGEDRRGNVEETTFFSAPAVPAVRFIADTEAAKEYVRRSLVRELKLEESELTEDQNLLLLGVDSIAAARLTASWRQELAVRLDPGVLLNRCTVRDWAEAILGAAAEAGPADTAAPAFDPEAQYEPFPLNEVQNAYFAGRSSEMEWGGVGCYASFEFDVPELDPRRFEQALSALVRRHGMLRCLISPDGWQQISPSVELPLTVYRRASIPDLPEHLRAVRETMATQVLPLGQPMFDMRLSELDGGCWRIHFGVDFLIADALSLYIFWRDMDRLYAGESLPELETTYRDYAVYAHGCRRGGDYERDKAYWLRRADDFPSAPEIPVNRTEAGRAAKRFVRRHYRLDREAWTKFKQAAAARRLTPSAALLGLYGEVLSAWGGGSRFAVMLTVFNRDAVHPQIDRVIGDFTRLMAVEIRREAGAAAENAAAVQARMREDMAHSRYSAIDFVRELNKKDSAGQRIYPFVFTSALGMEQLNGEAADGFLDRMGWAMSSTPQVWLDHQVYHDRDGVMLSWDTLDGVFPPGLVDAMFEKYVELVVRAANEESFWSKTLTDLRTERERQTQERANDTFRDMEEALLHERIRDRAAAGAGSPAVICAGRTYSYGELLARADQVSELLQERGVRKGDLVALQLGKSFDQIAAALGILQIGAAYAALPVGQPPGRTLETLRQAGIAVLVGESRIFEEEEGIAELTPQEMDRKRGVWRERDIKSSDLAYVIYTSGSTGRPKGVCITHGAAWNTISDVNRRLDVTAEDRILGVSSLSFDLSVYDIFGLLAAGGTLVLPTEAERIDPQCWDRLARRHRVSLWNSAPTLFGMYVDYLLTGSAADTGDIAIRHVLLSGDWIPLSLPDKLARTLPGANLTSLGGATEASIWSNYWEVAGIDPAWRSIPYGSPLANQTFHILDEFGRPCPDRVPGRLHIAGKGLAEGYWKEPELTGQTFFYHDELRRRVYDTGDYGCYMPDGAIEFLGRKDSQLKINGYRIEIGEVEAALRRCGFAEPIILPVGERMDSKKLFAFVRERPETFAETAAKRALRNELPDYMVPERIVAVERYPATDNGKIDRKRLLELAASEPSPARVDETRRPEHPMLREIRTVLHLPDLAPEDNLGDRGVSSVDIIRLANHLEAEYGDRPSVGDMVRYRTVSELLDYYGSRQLGVNSQSDPGAASQEPEPLPPESFAEMERLVQRCRAGGIELQAESGRLRFTAPRGAMTPELQADLKTNKAALIAYLQTEEASAAAEAQRPFRLTPIQLAYVLGRSPDYELGNTSAHYYAEYACADLDSVRLERAINETIGRHEMLRTVVYGNGTQQLLRETPLYSMPVQSVAGLHELEEIRSEWSHRRYELGEWPMFHIRLSRLPDRRTVLHLSFDCLILDGWSAELLFREIFDAYAGQPVAKPDFTFREYLNKEKGWLEQTGYLAKATAYWERRRSDMPPAPELPYKRPFAEIAEPHFRRLKYVLTPENTRLYHERIRKHRVTSSAVLCTAFMKVLSERSARPELTLNLTLFNRLPLHPDVPLMLGDFTNVTLISYKGARDSFIGETEEIQSQLWEAIEHRAYSGLDLLRQLSRDTPGKAVMPVVFTSLLFGDALAGEAGTLPPGMEEIYAISQTPQVALDHQAYERNGSLTLIWDYVEEAFDKAFAERLFDAYVHLVERLIADEDWSLEFAVELPDGMRS